MRQIILSVFLALFVVPFSSLYCMWYVVNPEDSSDFFKNQQKTYLLQKFMTKAAMCSSSLDAEKEEKNIQAYCNRHAESNGKETSYSIVCPDQECESQLSSTHGLNGVQHNLILHWYATKTHQPTFFEQASELLMRSQAEAKKKYTLSKKPFEVVPFPADQVDAENEDVQKKQVAVIPAVLAPVQVRAPVQQGTYYLLEVSHETPGIFATFFASSREEVLDAYLRSKMIQGKLDGMDYLKQELLDQTKKQRMVQGDAVKSLVCPAQGCKHQVTEAGQNPLAKLTLTLLVHYAAYHRHESPEMKALVALIAPSFLEARKKIEKGE